MQAYEGEYQVCLGVSMFGWQEVLRASRFSTAWQGASSKAGNNVGQRWCPFLEDRKDIERLAVVAHARLLAFSWYNQTARRQVATV